MKKLLILPLLAFAIACGETITQPEGAEFALTSDSENGAILLRLNDVCGVLLEPDANGPVSNYDGKYYLTETPSGLVNLNCTGATIPENLIPDQTYSFKWEFSGLACTNRITKAGVAHSNCHGKPNS